MENGCKKIPFWLEEMHEAHLDVVTDIEALSFSSPWKHRDFLFSMARDNSDCRVVLIDQQVMGYVVGFVIGREYHLADFAIHPAYRRQGIGHRVLIRAFETLDASVHVVSLEVRMSNLAVVGLYRQMGFETMAIRKDYYGSPREDALVMLKPIRGKLSDWVAQALLQVVGNGESFTAGYPQPVNVYRSTS